MLSARVTNMYCFKLILCVLIHFRTSVCSGVSNANIINLNIYDEQIGGISIWNCFNAPTYILLEGRPTEVVVNHDEFIQPAWCKDSISNVVYKLGNLLRQAGSTTMQILNTNITTGEWVCTFTIYPKTKSLSPSQSSCTFNVRVRPLEGPLLFINESPVKTNFLDPAYHQCDYVGQYYFKPGDKLHIICTSKTEEVLDGNIYHNNLSDMDKILTNEHNNSRLECRNKKNLDEQILIVSLYIHSSAAVQQDKIVNININLYYDEIKKTFVCATSFGKNLTNNDLVSVTAIVEDVYTPQGCTDASNRSAVFVKRMSKYSTGTKVKYDGDIVVVKPYMSTRWECSILNERKDWFHCSFSLNVQNSGYAENFGPERTSSMATATSSDFKTISQMKQYMPKKPIPVYTTPRTGLLGLGLEIRINNEVIDKSNTYYFINGEIIHITCNSVETTGIKFAYSGFGIDLSSLSSDYINAKEIQSKLTMKSTYNATYIKCILNRNSSKPLETRVNLVNKELSQYDTNKIQTPNNTCLYQKEKRIIIDSICESMGRTQTISSLKGNSGISIQGLKQSKVILQYINEINADVVLYEYTEAEILNLAWTIQPIYNSKKHVRVTWEKQGFSGFTPKTTNSDYLATHTVNLDASTNFTQIECMVNIPGEQLKEFWVIFYQNPDYLGKKSGDLWLKGLAAVACILFMALAVLLWFKRKSLCESHKSNEGNEVCQDITYANPIYDSLEENTKSRSNVAVESNLNPECLYSQPIRKSERRDFENKEYGQIEHKVNEIYNTIEECNNDQLRNLHGNQNYVNVEIENVGKANVTNGNIYEEKCANVVTEIYCNVNNKNSNKELYCEPNFG